jgi:hypothetical protein
MQVTSNRKQNHTLDGLRDKLVGCQACRWRLTYAAQTESLYEVFAM